MQDTESLGHMFFKPMYLKNVKGPVANRRLGIVH